jgi:phytoene dehydrogenase-like protein
MRHTPVKPSYDVVIIGAGISGLTSAALLSRAGLSVGVFEMDSRPGGYLAGFRRKDFRFDSAIHWLNQCGPRGLVTRVFDFIGNDHPTALSQPNIKRYQGDNYDYLLTDKPDDFKEELIKLFPHEKDGIERFFKDAKQIGAAFDSLPAFSRSLETMGFAEKFFFNMKRLKFAMVFLKHIRFTGPEGTVKGLQRYFKDPAMLKIFGSEEELLSALVPIGWAYYGDYQSPPKGGSQVFPEWLVHVVETLGNDVCYQCRVEKIDLENGQAVGISLDRKGEKISVKAKHIIAACDVEALYERMLPETAIPAVIKEKLNKAQLYSSAVTVSLGINCPVEELGLDDAMLFIVRDDVKRTEHNAGDPHKAGISVLAPSFRDSSLAPAGKGTMTIYCYATFNQNEKWKTEVDANGKLVRGEAYHKFKQEFADILIDRVEKKLGKEIRSHIEYCDIATPITHWRYTGNRDGSLMGARPGKANMQAKIAGHRTPVKNLWLSGHWADLGGGVPIAVKTGMNAALLVMKELSPKAFKVLAEYVDVKITKAEADKSGVFSDYDNSWVQELTPAEKKVKKLEDSES